MEDRQQSEFNMAVSYLDRLNILLVLCNDASTRSEARHWLNTLMALYRELSTEMTDTELSGFKQKIILINGMISQEEKRAQRMGMLGLSNNLLFIISDFEIDLRKILKSAGLQQRMADEATKALR